MGVGNLTKVKVCGITNLSDAEMCIGAGVDLLGFVTEFPVPVPWNLKRDESLAIIDQVRERVATVVVTSGPVETILEIARMIQPEFIQLHGRETLAEIITLVEKLTKIRVKVIKALSIEQETGEANFEIKDPKQAAQAIEASGVWAITADSKTRSMPAGTGKTMNWSLAAEINQMLKIPMLLAGGLKAENAAQAIAQVKPFGLDVISGVEKSYGQKDPEQVKLFVQSVKK
jgi:phosphoribosylanthranilate isomerase